MNDSSSSQYWAATDSTEIGSKLKSRLDTWIQATTGSTHLAQCSLSWTRYYGGDVEGVGATASSVTRSGTQGEIAEVRVPHDRALVNGVHAIICGPRLSWELWPRTNDLEDKSACLVGGNWLEYYWKDRGVEALASETALQTLLYGEGFCLTYWDQNLGEDVAALGGKLHRSGDIRNRIVHSWDVLRDPTVKSWDEQTSVAVVLFESKYDVAARFPKQATEILALGTANSRWSPQNGTIQVESDQIPVIHWWHKRTEALPAGRQTVMLDSGLVLSDDVLEKSYWKYGSPLHRLSFGDITGVPWPYAATWAAGGVSQMADSLWTSISTNLTATSAGLISVESTEELSPYDFSGGPKILPRAPGTSPPVAIDLKPVSPESFKALGLLKQEAQQLVGLNETTMGSPPGANFSGAALAMLASTSIQANSQPQAKYVAWVARIGNAHLQLAENKLTTPRKMALAGKGRSHLVQVSSVSGDLFKRLDRCVVSIGNPLSQTPAGRYQQAELIIKSGAPATIEQIQMVLDTGRADPLTEAASNRLLLIAAENDAMSRGEAPPVMLDDPHALHLMEHPAVMASMEARLDQKRVQAYQKHRDEHLRLLRETDPQILMALGQRPPAPPAPAMGADAGAPPVPGPVNPAGAVRMPTNPLDGQQFAPAGGAAPDNTQVQ